jgi:putative nucleotidyltransferase with HDIG domain
MFVTCVVVTSAVRVPIPSVVEAEITRLFTSSGYAQYYSEPVSHVEHALQCAQIAEDEGHSDDVVVAALLHDIGHISAAPGSQHMHRDGMDVGVMDHEVVGAAWLRQRGFSEQLCSLVQSHVESKRYLCATNATYYATLASDSVRSLSFQGGPMNASEVAAFDAREDAADRVALRTFDERGKKRGKKTQLLEHFIAKARRHLDARAAATAHEL